MSNVIISKFSDGTNIGYIAPQSYFECSTAAATAAKTATSPDSVVFSSTSLSRGTTVFVKFTNENTADSPTLQIGTSTAKSISGSAKWSAGSVVAFTYDGTNWIQGSGDSSGDSPVVVTADISNNPQLFSGLMEFLGGADEIIPWTQTYSSDLISALESDAATKFTDIITNSKQGIFRIKFKNTANANADVEFNFPLDVYASLNTNASNPIYTLMGQMGSSNSGQTHPRTFYVGIRLVVTSSATTISQIVLSTGNAEEIITSLFDYDSSISAPSYKLKLSHGGTGLSANDADNWYTSNTLHPHFTVFLNPLNAAFTCQYQGPLPDTVSSVSDALAADEVQYALKQPVPVMMLLGTNTRQVGTGLIDNYGNMMSNTSMRVLFTDWVSFDGSYVNGIRGTLTYASADGLFLDDVYVNVPKVLDLSTDAADQVVQTAVGSAPVGSTTQPVYWTGSAFTPVSGSMTPSFTTDTLTTTSVNSLSTTAGPSVYTGGGTVTQTAFTSAPAVVVTEGVITAASVHTGGGAVSQSSFTSSTTAYVDSSSVTVVTGLSGGGTTVVTDIT